MLLIHKLAIRIFYFYQPQVSSPQPLKYSRIRYYLKSGSLSEKETRINHAQAKICFTSFSIPLLSRIPILGPIFFTEQSVLVYIGYLLTPLAWYYINKTRPGMHLRAVGEYPAAADALGINAKLFHIVKQSSAISTSIK